MKRLRASLLHGSILALAAACGLQCATDAQAQAASPPPGKALIVLYRNDKQPVAARVPVIVNADRFGDLGNGEFINAVVNPGRTFLRVGDRILTTLAVAAQANQTSYVLVEAVPGMTPVRVEMREMTEGAARRVLAQSRPARAGAVAAAPAAAAARAPAASAPAAAPAPRAPVAAVAPAVVAPRPAPPAPVAAAPVAPRAQPAPPPPAADRRFSRIAQEPPPPDEEEEAEAELRKWSIALIPKVGVFNLATTTQTIGGQPSTYDKSSPILAFETELRHLDGFALGVEFLYYKNSVSVANTTFKGEQSVLGTMVNGKYYFGSPEATFHPFLGIGAGVAGAKFSGDIQGQASGPAFQGMLGADIRFSHVGIYLEYKYLSATASDNTNQKIKIGGSGVLAGLSIAF